MESEDLPPAVRLRNESAMLELLGKVMQEMWDSRVHYQVIMSRQACEQMAAELLPHAATKIGVDWSRVNMTIGDHGLHYLVSLKFLDSEAESCEVFVNAMPLQEVRKHNVSALLKLIVGMALEQVKSEPTAGVDFVDIKAGLALVDEALAGCRVCDERVMLVCPSVKNDRSYLSFMVTLGERGDPGDTSIFCEFEVPWE